MRLRPGRLVLAALLLAAVVVAPVSAQAQGLGTSAVAANCPKPQPYPMPPDATVFSSATLVRDGETIKASGTGYCPDEDIDITICGKTAGTAHSDANGNFKAVDIVVTCTGARQLCAAGETDIASNRDCLTLNVQAAAPDNNNGNPDDGGPAFTGVQVALLAALALLLIAGGVAFATAGRERKSVV